MKDAQNKLSKRNGDASYQDLIAKGCLPQAILNYICLLGWSPKGEYAEQEIFSLPELVRIWDPAGISKSPGHLRPPQAAGHQRRVYPPPLPRGVPPEGRALDRQRRPLPHQQGAAVRQPPARCEMFSDIPPQIDFFDALPDYDLSLYANKKQRPPRPPPWRPSPPWSCCSRTRAPTTATGTACSTPARLWPSGWSTRTAGCCTPWASPCRARQRTPGGGVDLACMMGRDKTVQRLRTAIDRLRAAAQE